MTSIGATPEYLNELLQDKTTISKMPKIFVHVERLLDQEITKVRNEMFGPGPTNGVDCPIPAIQGEPMKLPTPIGNKVKVTQKVYAPIKEHPKYNFVGRVIGPRGLTLRSVEYETGCKLLVRGRGSMKDKKMEEEKRGQPNYEHLDEDLHVLISVEDTEERANIRTQAAMEKVKGLLQPIEEGEDLLKKKQLKDLALLNGTLRETGGAGVKEFYPGKYFDDNADRLLAEREKFKILDRNRDLGISMDDAPASVLQSAGLLGMPLTAAGLQAYPFHPRPPGPAAYAPLGLELQGYAPAPRTMLDYGALEPAIIEKLFSAGAVKPRRPIREHPYQR